MRTSLRPELESIIPSRMRARPIDERGYSIPWFVDYVDGKPDFRCADQRKLHRALAHNLCWLCGEKLGRHLAFVIGPMCVINRVTSEPACHLECATYAVKGCPFLTLPKAQYRETNLPADHREAAGCPLKHNPTACAIYTTRGYRVMAVQGGILLRLAEPDSVTFWHRGRIATRAEVFNALHVGFPKLIAMARDEGPAAVAELKRLYEEAAFYFPVDNSTAGMQDLIHRELNP